MRYRILLVVAAVLLASVPADALTRVARLRRLVVVGDSLLAGFGSGGFVGTGRPGQRDNAASTRALSDLKRAAQGSENLVPRIVAAVKARATLGEIANAMREVFGEHSR